MKNEELIVFAELFEGISECYSEAAKKIVRMVNSSKKTSTEVTMDDVISEGMPEEIAPNKADTETETNSETGGTLVISLEELNSIPYGKLKKLAKDLGLEAKGSRETLISRILNSNVQASIDEEAVTEAVTEEVTDTSKVVDDVPFNTEEEEDEDPVEKMVNEAVADMTDEEILDFLTEVGIKARGKRQSLISAVIKGVREGKIELEDSSDSESSEDSDESEEINTVYADDEEVTIDRARAIENLIAEVNEMFEEGSITRQEIIEWLCEFFGEDRGFNDSSDEELIDTYIQASAQFIDDEGNTIEDNGVAYTVNGTPYCCGTPLDYDKKANVYKCSQCGSEYEAG